MSFLTKLFWCFIVLFIDQHCFTFEVSQSFINCMKVTLRSGVKFDDKNQFWHIDRIYLQFDQSILYNKLVVTQAIIRSYLLRQSESIWIKKIWLNFFGVLFLYHWFFFICLYLFWFWPFQCLFYSSKWYLSSRTPTDTLGRIPETWNYLKIFGMKSLINIMWLS